MTNISTFGKQPLGRGLSALLGPELDSGVAVLSVPHSEPGNYQVSTDKIRAGSQQPRTVFDESELADLTASIKEVGIIQPIVVRRIQGEAVDCDYEIIAGERRWRAAKRLKLSQVPVVVRQFTDEVALEVGLIENLQRHDLSPMEEAEGFQLLMDKFGCTQETLSQRLGKSRSYIANTLRLVNLPISLQDYVRSGRLSAGHARVLLSADNPEELAQDILSNQLNVREVEKRLKAQKTGKKPSRQRCEDNKDTEILGLEHMLTSTLEAPVKVEVKGDKAVVTITCSSLRKLDDVIEKITKEG